MFETHVWGVWNRIRTYGVAKPHGRLTACCLKPLGHPNILAGRVGFEPTTCGLTVRCTNRCAISQYKKMLCWRRESLAHFSPNEAWKTRLLGRVRLSTFNLLQRISNYVFSNTFCGCNRIRTYVCYQLHGHSPKESLHASICVRRWNRTIVVVGLQPTAKPSQLSPHIFAVTRGFEPPTPTVTGWCSNR